MVSPFKCFCLRYFSYKIPNFSPKFALKVINFVPKISPNFMPKSAGQPVIFILTVKGAPDATRQKSACLSLTKSPEEETF